MRSSSTDLSAMMLDISTFFLDSISACSASFFFSACSRAISDIWAARLISISLSCFSLAYSSSFIISSFWRSASRFLLAIATSVSCSISFLFLRRSSIFSVSFVKPSASNALSGLKWALLVWSNPVNETVSSSRPFLRRSSVTTCWTFWTKSTRCSWSSSIAISAATARRASTNLPSTSVFNSSGFMVLSPNVWAELAMASTVGLALT